MALLKITINLLKRQIYDKYKPSKHIRYFDANNLYGWARLNIFQQVVLSG